MSLRPDKSVGPTMLQITVDATLVRDDLSGCGGGEGHDGVLGIDAEVGGEERAVEDVNPPGVVDLEVVVDHAGARSRTSASPPGCTTAP